MIDNLIIAILIGLVIGLWLSHSALAQRVRILEQKVRNLLPTGGFTPTVAPGSTPPGTPGMSDLVKQLAADPRSKIAAIKAYREETDVGLKEAKDAVEAYIDSLK
jgi:ribosomal protein L7/L12